LSVRRRIAIAALIYLIIGGYFALGFTLIPAANLSGAAYVALTWPAWVKGSPIHIGMPSWAFSFENVE
jgi:hypothetical protein